jgi:hypothetical protein
MRDGQMLKSFDETVNIISSGKLLHIAGEENLLKRLPKGNWIGGSTIYFMTENGGVTSNDKLFVTEFDFTDFDIKTYNADELENISKDSADNGFSIVVIPHGGTTHYNFAKNSANYTDIYKKPIMGWITGGSYTVSGFESTVVNGILGKPYTDAAVVIHVRLHDGKKAVLKIVNIFEQSDGEAITFFDEGEFVDICLADGKEVKFSEYIDKYNNNRQQPLVADYCGARINISIDSINETNGMVRMSAPVFTDIEYRFAKAVPDYEAEFLRRIKLLGDTDYVFSVNCLWNYIYGELEGKNINMYGPVTFGEIAIKLLNQTLVYIEIIK